jgi:hypothetical protein
MAGCTVPLAFTRTRYETIYHTIEHYDTRYRRYRTDRVGDSPRSRDARIPKTGPEPERSPGSTA